MGVIEPFHGVQGAGTRPEQPLAPTEVADAEPDSRRRLTLQRASFAGPLPPPTALAAYDHVIPGLAREIVDQWKAETAHRHRTVTSMAHADREAMVKFYEAERRGQWLAIVAILGVLAVAVVAIVLNRPAVGIAGLLTGGAAAVWAMRRRSGGPDVGEPAPLDDGDAVERAP
jgi:uncharacterized membrane protein